MFRFADYDDLDAIMEIINKTIAIMREEGNPQWNEDYPARDVFINDIDCDSLYVYETDGVYEDVTIAGFICINDVCPPEYSTVTWGEDFTSRATYIHRFAVDPKFRRMGIGNNLLLLANEVAKHDLTYYLRTDTNSMNVGMNSLFKKCGFKKRGEIYLRFFPEHFNCYDKTIKA